MVIFKNKKALVTGGAGFIGSHLCEELLSLGIKVTALDNLTTSSVSNIRHLKKDKNFTFLKGSVTDKTLVRKLVRQADMVFHLAAAVGVKLIVEKPLESLQSNIDGTRYVLEACAKYKKKVLITSSSEVYGHQPRRPIAEDSRRIMGPTTVGRWSYASGKAVDEFYAMAYGKDSGIPFVIVRLFNTVGPRQVPFYGMVLPSFIEQALVNRPVTVYGDGRQVRTFGHVKDVVRAIWLLSGNRKAEGRVINVGGNQPTSIKALARRIIKRAGSSSRIKYIPYHDVYGENFEDVKYRIPDITLLNALTDFHPSYSLDQIIDDTIEHVRSRKK